MALNDLPQKCLAYFIIAYAAASYVIAVNAFEFKQHSFSILSLIWLCVKVRLSLS